MAFRSRPRAVFPNPGTLRAASAWTLAGLPDGAYTWTLQAIDSAYNAGPVAGAAFFVGIPPTPIFADGFESGGTSGWSAVAP